MRVAPFNNQLTVFRGVCHHTKNIENPTFYLWKNICAVLHE